MSSDPWGYFHLARAAKGRKEESFWRRFVEGIEPEMRGFARAFLRKSGAKRKLGDLVEAEDVLFEALLRLYEARHRVEQPRSWLYAVVRNVVLEHLRKAPEDGSSEKGLETIPVPAQNAREMDLATRRQVRSAILRLRKPDRELIIAYYYLNVGRKDLAQASGIKCNSVTQQLLRSVRRLGALLPRRD